jgi:hypothetical protein
VEAVVTCTGYAHTVKEQDMDILLESILKTALNNDVETQRKASSAMAALLLTRQVSKLTAIQKARAKANAGSEVLSSEDRTSSTVALEVADLFSRLPRLLEKYVEQYQLCAVMLDVYGILCVRIGAVWTQGQLQVIIEHLYKNVVDGLRLSALPRQRCLAMLEKIETLITDVISHRLMDEPGRLVLVRDLFMRWLAASPSDFGYEWTSSKWVLLCSLNIIHRLMLQLRGAMITIQVSEHEIAIKCVIDLRLFRTRYLLASYHYYHIRAQPFILQQSSVCERLLMLCQVYCLYSYHKFITSYNAR